MRISAINHTQIVANACRMEGDYFLNDYSFLSMLLDNHKSSCEKLGNLAEVFNPSVFKRQFCVKSSRSVEYFQSSDVSCLFENSPVSIFKGQAESLNLLVKKDDILVTGFGTIGNVRLVSKYQDGKCFANNVCRIRVNNNKYLGYVYAFMASKYGEAQLNRNATGSVVRYIEAPNIKKTLIPIFSDSFILLVNDLILSASHLREEATDYLYRAQLLLKKKANLPDLTPDYYDYYGPADPYRTVSTFIRKRKDTDATTLNAFNHSERIKGLERMIGCECCHLEDVLLGGEFFSTGSFPRVEVKEKHGIMLVNQSDIFDNIIKGKYISKRGVKTNNLVEYGEVMIAGVGTLGENETFCRTIFANEDLEGQLVSGEFLRMKTNGKVPSGYLYAWLSSDYGFRLIRSTQTGTKLCRPIQKLLLKKKIPIIDSESMNEIDELVREAQTRRHKANQMELKAISMVEQEIEKWSN